MSSGAGEFAKWTGATIGGAILLGVVTPWGAAIQGHQVARSGHSGLLAWVDPLFTAMLVLGSVSGLALFQVSGDKALHPAKRLLCLIGGVFSGFFAVLSVQLLWLYLFTSHDFERSWLGRLIIQGIIAVVPGEA